MNKQQQIKYCWDMFHASWNVDVCQQEELMYDGFSLHSYDYNYYRTYVMPSPLSDEAWDNQYYAYYNPRDIYYEDYYYNMYGENEHEEELMLINLEFANINQITKTMSHV
jgi:hypothetical protein